MPPWPSNTACPWSHTRADRALVPGANDLNFSVMQQAQNDPRMYQLYLALMADWQQVGGGLFDAYQLDGVGSQYGFWGLLPNVLATGSQKYDALLSVILPAGDANLDGIVDYADFQTLEANYGTTDAYWEQGDFNDDGAVNWQDLNILRQNLDPAGFTLSQFAQQAVFGEPSTVDSPTALEYDGYGVTYASSLPFAASIRDGQAQPEQPGPGDRPGRGGLLRGVGSPRQFLGLPGPERPGHPVREHHRRRRQLEHRLVGDLRRLRRRSAPLSITHADLRLGGDPHRRERRRRDDAHPDRLARSRQQRPRPTTRSGRMPGWFRRRISDPRSLMP